MAVAFFMRGPIALWWYNTLNPWYIKNIFTRIFSKAFMTNFDGSWRKVLTCMVMDTFILQWTTTPVYVFVVNMLENSFDFSKAMDGWSRKVMASMFASFKFLPFYKICVYSMPMIFRPVVAYALAVVWSIIFSYICHNY